MYEQSFALRIGWSFVIDSRESTMRLWTLEREKCKTEKKKLFLTVGEKA